MKKDNHSFLYRNLRVKRRWPHTEGIWHICWMQAFHGYLFPITNCIVTESCPETVKNSCHMGLIVESVITSQANIISPYIVKSWATCDNSFIRWHNACSFGMNHAKHSFIRSPWFMIPVLTSLITMSAITRCMAMWSNWPRKSQRVQMLLKVLRQHSTK